MRNSHMPGAAVAAPPVQQEYDDEEEDLMPYESVEKSSVLLKAREFSAITISVSGCTDTLLHVLYVLNSGQLMSTNEATEVFFGATKLFQNENVRLRRILYIALKELGVLGEQVFIASSSLVKDIQHGSDFQRANALRVLRKVTDSTMIGPMERYLRQCVVDKNPSVVNAAIVTGIHLSNQQPEMVKRWGTEVSEALKNRGSKVQYAALTLLHKLRKSDRMSVVKLVQQASQGGIRAPLALCHLIKLCGELMNEDFTQSAELYKFVNSMTHHSHDCVVLEAAKAICSLRNVTAKEVQPAISVLQIFLTNARPVMRFAAVRLLSRVAAFYPALVAACNIDLEALVNDPNRNIATLAITALLKTGSDAFLERLLKQIGTFMHDLPDEYRIVVVDSLRIMCAKFPDRYVLLLNFLMQVLRADGGGELKNSIVETMISMAQTNQAARETALTNLCDYIEDSEYNNLMQRILYVIGELGPTTANPTKFVRYVYNRIALESPIVRAAAVTTLAKMAAASPQLRPRIVTLLRFTSNDSDDDVRDRAVLYHKILSGDDAFLIKSFITDVSHHVAHERQLAPAIAAPSAADTAATVAESIAVVESANAAKASGASSAQSVVQAELRDRLSKIPQLRAFGIPLRTTELTPLTDADNEYVVSAARHYYKDRIVLHFKVSNSMEDKKLHHVVVKADVSELEVEPEFAIPMTHVDPGQSGYCYVVLKREPGTFPTGTVHSTVAFCLSDHDAAEVPNADDADEFQIEDFDVDVSDYIAQVELSADAFQSAWRAAAAAERVDTYQMASMRNLTIAAKQVADFFNMFVVGGRPEKITTAAHSLEMAGTVAFVEDAPLVLIEAKVFITTDSKVALKLSIRGGTDELREFLSTALVS